MRMYLLGAFVALFSAVSAQAKMCNGIFPKNTLWIPANALTNSGLSQKAFNGVLDKVQSVYGPIAQAHGGVLQFNRLWDDGTVNSDTDLEGNTWVVNSYGGLARYKGMTADGYTAIACHEIGHHLGGAPIFAEQQWASVEGEADYFATLKCFKTVFANDDNQSVVAAMKVDPTAKSKCETSYPNNAAEIALCERASMAGKVIANIAADLGQESMPNFNTPDPTVVDTTFEDHPGSQCRLDTYFAGSICTAPTNQDLGTTDPKVGACSGSTPGARPLCWFAPGDFQ